MTTGTILNVDDNDAKRYVVTRTLLRAGFAVREAQSGGEALRLALEGPDLVVLDVNLPDLHGFEVCRRLRADPRTAKLAVLHLSASFVSSDHRVTGLEGGADAYLTQPVEPEELVATVRALLRVRHAEETSRRLAAEWQATFDAISDGVGVIDGDGRLRRCNRALGAALGREAPGAPPAIGLPLRALLHEALGLRDLPEPLAPGAGEGRRVIERPAPAGDRWFRLSLDLLGGEGASAGGAGGGGAVCILEDVSERKQAEEDRRRLLDQARAALRVRDDFLATAAHELLTPITAIGLTLHAAQRGVAAAGASGPLAETPGSPAARLSARLSALRRQMERIEGLVRMLLDASRLAAGRLPLEPEDLDLTELARELVESTSARDGGRTPIELHAAGPLRGAWDRLRLDQALSNLLANAVKFGAGRPVHLTLEEAPGEAVVTVRDEGIGIAPEDQRRIFAQFERAVPLRNYGGFGLGLWIVARSVEQLGGAVALHSRPGQGATFTLRLPLRPPAAPEGALGASP